MDCAFKDLWSHPGLVRCPPRRGLRWEAWFRDAWVWVFHFEISEVKYKFWNFQLSPSWCSWPFHKGHRGRTKERESMEQSKVQRQGVGARAEASVVTVAGEVRTCLWSFSRLGTAAVGTSWSAWQERPHCSLWRATSRCLVQPRFWWASCHPTDLVTSLSPLRTRTVSLFSPSCHRAPRPPWPSVSLAGASFRLCPQVTSLSLSLLSTAFGPAFGGHDQSCYFLTYTCLPLVRTVFSCQTLFPLVSPLLKWSLISHIRSKLLCFFLRALMSYPLCLSLFHNYANFPAWMFTSILCCPCLPLGVFSCPHPFFWHFLPRVRCSPSPAVWSYSYWPTRFPDAAQKPFAFLSLSSDSSLTNGVVSGRWLVSFILYFVCSSRAEALFFPLFPPASVPST